MVFSDCTIFISEAFPIEQEDNIFFSFMDCISESGATYNPFDWWTNYSHRHNSFDFGLFCVLTCICVILPKVLKIMSLAIV